MRRRIWIYAWLLIVVAAASNLLALAEHVGQSTDRPDLWYYPELIINGRYACLEVRKARGEAENGFPNDRGIAPIIQVTEHESGPVKP